MNTRVLLPTLPPPLSSTDLHEGSGWERFPPGTREAAKWDMGVQLLTLEPSGTQISHLGNGWYLCTYLGDECRYRYESGTGLLHRYLRHYGVGQMRSDTYSRDGGRRWTLIHPGRA